MRLLFLTPQLPYPPHKGTTIRNFHLLKNLADRHEITLLSFSEDGTSQDRMQLQQYCANVEVVAQPRRSLSERLFDLPFPARPDLVRRLRSPAFLARLRQLLEHTEFDIVQIEGLEMALHWEMLLTELRSETKGRLRRVPTAILDDHNAEYVLQRRAFEIDRQQPRKWRGALYSFIQWQKLVRYERQFCRIVAGIVAASAFDQKALLELQKSLRIAVVPNGVDTDHYQPPLSDSVRSDPRLIFTGTMDFRPNVDGMQWFCHEVWPEIVAQVPNVSLWIVGRNPKDEIKRLADGERVVVTGAVPDIRPFLASATAAIVPLRIGGGSRLKVLEAMAAGVPICSTSLGCEGIAVTPSTAVIADRPDHLARAVIDLLCDEPRRRAQIVAARELVERSYDWNVIVPRLDDFYHEILCA